jgi:hypothetical protein
MREFVWSPAEKKAAHAAFDAALARECTAMKREVEAILQRSSDPAEIWRVHERETTRDRSQVRFPLFGPYQRAWPSARRGWASEAEIAELKPEKIEQIKHSASLWKADHDRR